MIDPYTPPFKYDKKTKEWVSNVKGWTWRVRIDTLSNTPIVVRTVEKKYMDNSDNTTPSDFAKLANIYIQKVKKNDHKQANFDKAIAIYENMAKKWPSLQNWAYLQAGIQGTSCGFDDKGAEYLLKIINNLEPNKDNLSADDKGTLISALQNIGYYYWGTKNNLEEAKPYYQKLLELSPDDKNAKAALGIE